MHRPAPENGFHPPHARLLLDSYERALGRPLIARDGTPEDQARALFQAPFVVLSHNGAADPILTYGNQTALTLWETTWEALTQMPSRLTAEAEHRDARAKMLASIRDQGFIDDYAGIRISATGKRFRIEQAVIWTLWDAQGARVGQAATFDRVTPL